jgi:hypothetical protein
MKAIKVQANGTLTLPREILRACHAAGSMAVWTDGDLIVLKRIRPLKPSAIAARRPSAGPSLKAIASEIHRMRREMRGQRD